MQTVSRNYRSLNLLWEVHGDKLVMTIAIAGALAISSGLGTFLLPTP